MKDKINLEKAKLSNTALSHYDGKKKNPKMTRSLVLKCSYISFSFFFFSVPNGRSCKQQSILRLCAWLPGLGTGVRLRLTLL